MHTPEEMRQRFTYEPSTGSIIRASVSKMANKRYGVGSEAGHLSGLPGAKRKSIDVDGVAYHFHRVAWVLHYGEWPKQWLDHINGDPLDNRVENLRLATQRQNAKNRRVQKSSTVGVKGVERHVSGKWRARITSDGKCHHLGLFETMEEARDAYNAAAQKLHGEFARVS